MNEFISVTRGDAPLIVSIPHAGATIPASVELRLQSPWRGRMDADWHVPELYDFAVELGATVVTTAISRTVIDVNRDPSGASLYPGQATTGLCPETTFDGAELYREGRAPTDEDVEKRRGRFFVPYHAALQDEIVRLKRRHDTIVLYDAHAIRSRIARLFEGELPVFNIGTNGGRSCDQELSAAAQMICVASGQPTVANGRFKGGYITRHYGRPFDGVHALQMELAMRAYLVEPTTPDETNWPPPLDEALAAPTRATLKRVLEACLTFAREAT